MIFFFTVIPPFQCPVHKSNLLRTWHVFKCNTVFDTKYNIHASYHDGHALGHVAHILVDRN